MRRKILHSILLLLPFLALTISTYGQCRISCPSNMTVANQPGLCGASVSFSVTGDNCTISASPASGSFFPVGTTTVTITATATNGSTSTCSFTVTVNDTEAPRISNVSATPNSLWPPNHKMNDVTVNYTTTDNCPGPVTCQLSVRSNEPVNDIGDGNTAPDWIVLDAHRVQLRAERAGPLNGRVYTITIGCRDQRNNISTATTAVTVPHDQGNRKYSGLKMAVSPNPSRTYFTLNVNSQDRASKIIITVSDLQGRVLESRNNVNPNQAINVGGSLRNGTYIIKAQQGDSITETQVVKQ
jgi:hypothetical protein